VTEQTGRAQFKNQDPPLWVAWHQALASIRVRFFRQLITSSGIALGIAFFVSMQMLRMAESTVAKDEARLTWLIGTSLIKCLGASDSFIVRVFFIEAALLGFFGSTLGSLLGIVLSIIVCRVSGLNPPYSAALSVLGLGIGMGIAMTVISAIAPAIQAAKMPAAAALRMDI